MAIQRTGDLFDPGVSRTDEARPSHGDFNVEAFLDALSATPFPYTAVAGILGRTALGTARHSGRALAAFRKALYEAIKKGGITPPTLDRARILLRYMDPTKNPDELVDMIFASGKITPPTLRNQTMTISLNPTLKEREKIGTLAHELAHGKSFIQSPLLARGYQRGSGVVSRDAPIRSWIEEIIAAHGEARIAKNAKELERAFRPLRAYYNNHPDMRQVMKTLGISQDDLVQIARTNPRYLIERLLSLSDMPTKAAQQVAQMPILQSLPTTGSLRTRLLDMLYRTNPKEHEKLQKLLDQLAKARRGLADYP